MNVTIDDTFVYINDKDKGVVLVVLKKFLEGELNNQFQKIKLPQRFEFERYISDPWWYIDPKVYKDYVNRNIDFELEFLSFIVDNYPKISDEVIISRNELKPKTLINFLDCFCWINKHHESECIVLGEIEYDFSIYEYSKSIFGSKRGEKIVAFRFNEFERIRLSTGNTYSFRVETKFSSFNGRMDKRWNGIY